MLLMLLWFKWNLVKFITPTKNRKLCVANVFNYIEHPVIKYKPKISSALASAGRLASNNSIHNDQNCPKNLSISLTILFHIKFIQSNNYFTSSLSVIFSVLRAIVNRHIALGMVEFSHLLQLLPDCLTFYY